MNRSEKATLISQIKAKADTASFVVVTDFKGISVEELTCLRTKLRESGGEYLVIKNTLARIAFTNGIHNVIKDQFKENCAIAFGYTDPIAIAKTINEFVKTSKFVTIRHGSLEGTLLTTKDIEDLAQLPSKPELIAQVLGTMNAVPTNFVSLFANIIRPILYALQAIEAKKAA